MAFCLVWCLRLRLLVRGALEAFSLTEGVGKLCICSRTVCLVLCCVMYFDMYLILLCCLGIWRSWLRRFCLGGFLPVLPGAAGVFLEVSSTSGMCVLPSPSANLCSFLRCLFNPSCFLLSLVSNVKVARSRRS